MQEKNTIMNHIMKNFFFIILLSATTTIGVSYFIVNNHTISRNITQQFLEESKTVPSSVGYVSFPEGSEFGTENILVVDKEGNLDTEGTVTLGDLYVGGTAFIDSLNLAKFLYVAGNQIIDATGRIPKLTADYIANLDGSALTGVNANKLDGVDSTGFIKTGTAIDADKLDGKDSSDFITSGTEIDANKLDGIDSGSFLRSDSTDTAGGALTFSATPGSANVGGGPLYINPASATADYTLLGIAINGTEKFRVDAEGDVTVAGDLTVTGSISGSGTSPWTDAGTYLYPTSGETLGNSTSAGSNKIAGLYLSDSSSLVFGTDNDVDLNFSGSVLSTVLGINDFNIDSNSLFVDGSADNVGIGTNTPSGKLHIKGSADDQQLILQANGTQTSKVFEYQNSSGTVLTALDVNGHIAIGQNGIGSIGITALGVNEITTDISNNRIGISGGLSFNSSSNSSLQYKGGSFVASSQTVSSGSLTSGYGGLMGSQSGVSHNGSGTVTNAWSNHSYITGKNITNAYSYLTSSSSVTSGSTWTNWYGLGIWQPGGSGTITNGYGIVINNITKGSSSNFALVTKAGNVVFNEDADSSTDLRIEGGTDANLLFTDASADAIGIGTNSPASNMKLDVAGRVQINLGGTQTAVALCGSHSAASGASVSDVEIVDCTGTPAADYMEMYPVEESADKGTVVAVGSSNVTTKDGDTIKQLVRSTKAYQNSVIGIVSDKSKAGDFNSIGYNIEDKDNPQPIALAGRVPVKVANTSEEILAGDFITSSNETGKAMKATNAGQVIGKALESWSPNSGKSTVMVFVQNSYYLGGDTTLDSTSGSFLSLNSTQDMTNEGFQANDSTQTIITELETMQGLSFDNESNTLTATSIFKTIEDFISEGIATFKNTVKFLTDVTFGGRITFEDKDLAGYAQIKSGSNEVRVTFENDYTYPPIVQVTPQGNYNIKYWTTDVSVTGFTVKIDPVLAEDVQFSWSALSVKDAKTHEGNGAVLVSPTPEPIIIPSVSPSPTPIEESTSSAVLDTLIGTQSGIISQ